MSVLNQKGVELAQSIETVISALHLLENDAELADIMEIQKTIGLLRHMTQTAYRYVFELYKQ